MMSYCNCFIWIQLGHALNVDAANLFQQRRSYAYTCKYFDLDTIIACVLLHYRKFVFIGGGGGGGGGGGKYTILIILGIKHGSLISSLSSS